MVEPVSEPLVLEGALVRTMDGRRPLARSVAIAGGRIAALDQPLAGARRLRLDGATVVPGLLDSHLHLTLGGETLLQLDLSAASSKADVASLVAERHRVLPPEAWLVAMGWNEDGFDGRTVPDRTWLAAAGLRPAVAWRMDQHAVVVNDAVLDRLGPERLASDPPGGRIARGADGRPTGLFQEAAAWELIRPLMPSPSTAERRRAVGLAHRTLAACGLTAVGSMEYGSIVRDVLLPVRSDPEAFRLRMRLTLLDRDWPLDLGFARELAARPHDPMLGLVGMKAFVDGTLGSRTARMLAPYADDAPNQGLWVELAERGVLAEWVRVVRAAGLSPSMHAIGDAAVRLALEALEASDGPGAPPGRIEHAQTVAPEDLPRFRGRFASMQPLHKAYDARSAATRLGPHRMDRFFPFRRLREAGAILAFGSDWPIVSPDPILGMQAAITGRDLDGVVVRSEENVAPIDALRAYTVDAARCLGLDGCGTIAAGQHGDCTVLDRDPVTCDWERERPRVLATIVGGRVVHDQASIPC